MHVYNLIKPLLAIVLGGIVWGAVFAAASLFAYLYRWKYPRLVFWTLYGIVWVIALYLTGWSLITLFMRR